MVKLLSNSKTIGKFMMFMLMSGITMVNVSGCGLAGRTEQLAKQSYSDKQYTEELFQSMTEALEQEDKEALIGMFSSYAIENSSDLEEQLDKLIEFYPGCNGGYTVSISTYETSAYSGKEYIIYPQYTITNDDFEYRIRVTSYIKNGSITNSV